MQKHLQIAAVFPLMSLAYIGIKGGMVVMVANDPGPISSQTEQDTRTLFKTQVGLSIVPKSVAIGELPRSEKKTRRIFDNRY